jgi:hypothetical protein
MECVSGLPGLVQLQQKFPEQVAGVSVSLDYVASDAEAVKNDVLSLLQEKQIALHNRIATEDGNELQKKLGAAIPIVLIYDQSGKLQKQFHNGDNEYGPDGFSYQQHVTAFVEQLLKEPVTVAPRVTGVSQGAGDAAR